MEFTIRALVVIVMMLIAFVVIVALIAGWGGESGNILKTLTDWFSKVIRGEVTP